MDSAIQNAAISRISSQSYGLMIPLMKEVVSKGYFLKDIDLPTALTGVNILYRSITRGPEFREANRDPNKLFRDLVVVYVRGICTTPGKKQIDKFLKNSIQ